MFSSVYEYAKKGKCSFYIAQYFLCVLCVIKITLICYSGKGRKDDLKQDGKTRANDT